MESRPGQQQQFFGRPSPTIKDSREPFFSGWQDSTTPISRHSSGGLQVPCSPYATPSPRTVLPTQAEEERKGSVLLARDHHGIRVDAETAGQAASRSSLTVGDSVNGRERAVDSQDKIPINETIPSTGSTQELSPLRPAVLRRISNNLDEYSSGAEISDASSFAHLLTRKELSKRSFRKLMTGPNPLAVEHALDKKMVPRPAPSAPTILMESSTPVPRIEKPAPMLRSLTFSEALLSDTEAPEKSPSSSLGPLPTMPPRPRFVRAGRSSNEHSSRSVTRSGRGLNPRIQNRSTASSNQSLKPPSIQRTITSESGDESDRPHPESNHVSFGSLRDPDEAISPGHGILPGPGMNLRSSSFPWIAPARSTEEDRRFSYPVEKKQEKDAKEARPSLLARLMSTLSRQRHGSSNVVPSARSAASRRMSSVRERRNSGKPFPLPRVDMSGQSCVRKMSNLFLRRPPTLHVENSPILSPFTHDARAYMHFSSPNLSRKPDDDVGEWKRERSSISYRDSHGRHYVMPQKIGKRATWLPSEMTRINTPPAIKDDDGRGLKLSRGFFFDIRKPPGVEDDDITIRKQAVDKSRISPTLSSSTALTGPSPPLQTTQKSSSANVGLTQSTSRGTLLKRTMKRLHTASSYDSEATPVTRSEELYLGPPDYFRQRLNLTADSPKDEDMEYDWEVPEHLPNSPLCPRNAAMYGLGPAGIPGQGRRACPMHEKKRSDKGTSKDVVLGRPDRTRSKWRRDEWEDL